MKIQEVFKVLLENPINPVLVRNKQQSKGYATERNNTQLPVYSSSKGGRYWFNCGLISEDEILALFCLAVIIEQTPVIVHIPLSIYVEETDDTDAACLIACIDFDKEGELTLPLMYPGIAKQIYDNRSNGYCNLNTTVLINDKVCVELGGELCVNELLAIYSLLQDKKKALQYENKIGVFNGGIPDWCPLEDLKKED